jgi:hypothetical protein
MNIEPDSLDDLEAELERLQFGKKKPDDDPPLQPQPVRKPQPRPPIKPKPAVAVPPEEK